jgi:tetratricopeptide (TPR) repeat protein
MAAMIATRQSKPMQARLARVLLTSLLPLLFPAAAADAAPALSRAQALQALTQAPAKLRREALGRLGEIGVMEDTPALLRALRDADPGTRADAEQALWRIWSRSGDGRVDALYRAGVEQMSGGKIQRAIATFTRVIRLKPEFAEGWNKRATLYFLSGEYHKSLADCAQVIKRNPYHFGALAGYGQIYLRLEDYPRSLEYFRRALELNPNMDSVRINILLLEQLIEQRRNSMI